MSQITIRSAVAADVASILRLLIASAESQGSRDALCVTSEDLRREGFGDAPRFHALLAETPDRAIVGLALFYFNFSTWTSINGLYLEDLYVEPEWRRHGIARALMNELAQIARANTCGRFRWSVLRSNTAARRFYESLGGQTLDEWLLMTF
jgi:GNAT superfamily N-acetyltransferase